MREGPLDVRRELERLFVSVRYETGKGKRRREKKTKVYKEGEVDASKGGVN